MLLPTQVKASPIREADTTPKARSQAVIPSPWILSLAAAMPTQQLARRITATPPNRLLLTSMSRTRARTKPKPLLPVRLLPLPPVRRLR